jgi:putative membrane protein
MSYITLIALSAFLASPVFAEPTGTIANDGEIAEVLTTIDSGEIDAAKLELKKGKNPDTRSFAKMMIEDHKQNLSDTKTIAKKNSLDRKSTEFSKSLEKDAKSSNGDLKKVDKAQFDQAYVKQQIKMHEDALTIIDNTLLTKVENPNLREHLTKTRAAVEAHLTQAKELQSKF